MKFHFFMFHKNASFRTVLITTSFRHFLKIFDKMIYPIFFQINLYKYEMLALYTIFS